MKKKLAFLLPMTVLGFAALWLAASWITVRVLSLDAPEPEAGALSWNDAIGSHGPQGENSPEASLSPPMTSVLLQDVLSVEDAVEADGSWILLDSRGGTVHILESSTGLFRSFGRNGPGPGELQDPVAVAHSDSALWVLNQRGLFLDRFDLDGGFHSRSRLAGGGCLAGLAKELMVVKGYGPTILRVCPARLPGPGILWVEAVQSDGRLSPLLSMPLGTPGSRRLHLLRQPAAAARGERIYLGTWDAPCIGEYGGSGSRSLLWCLPDFQRAPASAHDKQSLRDRFRRITALGFLPMEIPDLLPWYDGIFPVSAGLVVRRIRGEETRDLVVLHRNGKPQVLGSDLPTATFVGEESVLTAEDVIQGTRVRIHIAPWMEEAPKGS